MDSIKVKQHEETEQLMQAAVDTTIPEIIKKQGTEGVDAVAEATKSSEAVIQGVNQALEKAKK
ncbi:FMN-binding protein [Paenibacillus larvae]|uniref:Uncharacterized protein n=2 Tax=Paenibacillus larvae TaxID=1464 RepID=A0A1U9YRN6_9BACL|nr:FMN-binding protein [Paenibacillus larvae]AQZ48101.1 hypothetical protein B5S25_17475 [Paenibacillus larvae subsp. pulvifaciens]ARF66820.1 hypothetical protein B7C51_01810 [Paenibacillus larvae subsp. pulvifaciens]MDR5605697.1 FMN-binding protein [Paenibacillus larvae]